MKFGFYAISKGLANFVGVDTAQAVSGATMQQAPNTTFAASVLKGNYAFLLSGSAPGGAITTAGSFAADGSGNITGGILDENGNGAPPNTSVAFLPNGSNFGTYSVDSTGRGIVTFATTNRTYHLVLYIGAVGNNATAGVIQETDSNITSDGSFTQQISASIQGNYAIATSGLSSTFPQVISGQLATDGAGKVTSGAIDINTAGTLTAGQPVSGSYTTPNTMGRATFTLNSTTPNYAAYVVSSTQVYMMGIQTGDIVVGSLLRQF